MSNFVTGGGEIDLSSFFSEMPIWPTLLAKLKSALISGGNWATGGGPIGIRYCSGAIHQQEKIKKGTQVMTQVGIQVIHSRTQNLEAM